MNELVKKKGITILLQLSSIVFLTLTGWQIVAAVNVYLATSAKISLPSSFEKIEMQSNQFSKDFTNPIFGKYVPQDIDAAGVKQSNIDVTIVGIMYASDDNSQVLLHFPDGYDHVLRVGDVIPGGGIIKRIAEEGILVLHNGVLERLSFPKDSLDFDEPSRPLKDEDDAY